MKSQEEQVAVAITKQHRDKLEKIRAHKGLRSYKDTAEALIDEEWNAIQTTQ